jgi:hypothetical protein
MWTKDDIVQFIRCLHRARYHDSEWCLLGRGDHSPPMKADSYLMGFNRFTGIESQTREPWIYFKFTIKRQSMTLLVFSLHHSVF